MRKRVLVCGATGFLGRNTVARLMRRPDLEIHAVRFTRPAWDAPGVTWHQADLRDAAAVERVVAGMDAVIQSAATTSGARDTLQRPHIHVTDNAVMNSLLLRAAHEHKVRQFQFFSCTVMLPSGDDPVDEQGFDANAELHPRYFGIGWTKVYVEKMCAFFGGLGVTRHTVFRHSNLYGPFDKFDLARSHVLGATITKALTSEDGRLVVWGAGEEARDLLYIDDMTDAIERALDRDRDEGFRLYNIGAGTAVTVKALVAAIVAASGRDLRIEHDLAMPSIPTRLSLDCAKARRELDWAPQVGLEEGLRRTIDWWRAHSRDGRAPEPDLTRG